MVVTCHQPHFLPWVPYFNKLVYSDVFIVLDDVNYRRQYYQNRTRIVDNDGRPYWLTMPVKHVKLGTPISKVNIDASSNAMRISINRLREAYRNQLSNGFLQSVFDILTNPPHRLIDKNLLLIELVLKEIGFTKINIIPISKIVGKKPRDERVLTALKEVGATKVTVGMGGMATAHDLQRWENEGIELCLQCQQNEFDDCSLNLGDGISILHDIVISGSTETVKIVKNFCVL